MQACRIEARDLACQRGERMLFAGLALALGPGEALHIAGANGNGKTSLLRILGGLLRPFAGAITRTGAIGLVDERPALDPGATLGRALAFWNRIDRPRDNPLARLGLADLLDVPVAYLSTGQKKRAAFARLLGQGAPVWLLDEPLNGLDAEGAALIEALAAEHCRAGGLCLIASHQPFGLPAMARLDLAGFAP
jgi:heme exporter protein A